MPVVSVAERSRLSRPGTAQLDFPVGLSVARSSARASETSWSAPASSTVSAAPPELVRGEVFASAVEFDDPDSSTWYLRRETSADGSTTRRATEP